MAGGSNPGERRGGRKKGTPNKRTVAKAAVKIVIAAKGMTPLEYMIERLNEVIPEDASVDLILSMRASKMEAAKAAAPYCHARITTIQGGPIDKPVQFQFGSQEADDMDAARRMLFIIERALHPSPGKATLQAGGA